MNVGINTPNVEMSDRFLDLLTGTNRESITFQFFSDKDKKDRKAARHRHMTRPLTYDLHRKKQKAGCGVYVMVNKGDGKGRKRRNVVRVRALFIDLDGADPTPAITALKPHIVVESSPGRYHLYWRVSDCSLEQFKPLQQAIARKYNVH